MLCGLVRSYQMRNISFSLVHPIYDYGDMVIGVVSCILSFNIVLFAL